MIAKVYVKQLITDSRINSRVGNSLVKFLSLYVSPREATDISFFAQPDHVGVFHYVVDCLDFMMI